MRCRGVHAAVSYMYVHIYIRPCSCQCGTPSKPPSAVHQSCALPISPRASVTLPAPVTNGLSERRRPWNWQVRRQPCVRCAFGGVESAGHGICGTVPTHPVNIVTPTKSTRICYASRLWTVSRSLCRDPVEHRPAGDFRHRDQFPGQARKPVHDRMGVEQMMELASCLLQTRLLLLHPLLLKQLLVAQS